MKMIIVIILSFINNLYCQINSLDEKLLNYSIEGIYLRMELDEFKKIYPNYKILNDNQSLGAGYEVGSFNEGLLIEVYFESEILKASFIVYGQKEVKEQGGIENIVKVFDNDFGYNQPMEKGQDNFQKTWYTSDCNRRLDISYNAVLNFVTVGLVLGEVYSYSINEEFYINNFVHKVESYEYLKNISNNFIEEKADGIFLILNLVVINKEKSHKNLNLNSFSIVIDSLYEYKPVFIATMAINHNNQTTYSLPPLIPKKISVVFEVPKKLERFILETEDIFDYTKFCAVRSPYFQDCE